MPLISSRLPLSLALATALAMVLATAWQAYQFWQTENSAFSSTGDSGTANQPQAQPQAPTVDLASVSLFGDESQAEQAPQANIDNLPETNLKLFLRGVMSASGDFPGSALVEDSKRQTEAYIVGDELPGNATLKTVRPDRIIIQRSGALENLYFPEDEDRSGIELAVNNPSNSEPEYAEQKAREASFPGPSGSSTSDSRREEIRQRLEQLRNRLRNNN